MKGVATDSTDSLQDYRLAAGSADVNPPSNDFRSNSPLSRRKPHLEVDIAQAQKALQVFLSNRHEEAQEILKRLTLTGESLYGSLGMGIVFLLKALLTFAPEDAAMSREYLQGAVQIAQRMKKGLAVKTVYSRLTTIFNRRARKDGPTGKSGITTASGDGRDEAYVQRHVELVTAECRLMGAILTVLTDTSGSWVMFMRESLHIRAAYMIYHAEFTSLAIANATSEELSDPHYESGVLLGIGLINVLFSLLPPRVFSLFSFLGYSGSLEVGLSQLQGAVACREGIRAPWAELALLLYHTVFAGALSVRPPPSSPLAGSDLGADHASPGDSTVSLSISRPSSPHPTEVLINDILLRRLNQYPTCPLYLFFHARHLILQSQIPAAIQVLEEALSLPPLEWPQILQTCVWELMTTSMIQLNWSRCYQLAAQLSQESRWSKCTAFYLQAIFLTATNESDPQMRDKVMRLYGMVLREETRIAGRRLAMEKYATLRAERACVTGELPFYPELELLLVWDVFMRMTRGDLERLRAQLDSIEREAHGSLDLQQQGLLLLCRASIFRANADYSPAEEILSKVATFAVPHDSYLHPVAYTELAQCSLLQHQIEAARKYYQLSSGYPHKYLLQRSIHLRQAKIKAELDRLS